MAQIEELGGYADEIRLFIGTVLERDRANDVCAPEDTARSVKIIEAIRKSASFGGERVKIQ